jgi:hypothetical protein
VPVPKRGVILLGIVLSCIAAAGFGKELFSQAGCAHLVYGPKDTPDTLDLTESGLPIIYAIAWNYLDPLYLAQWVSSGWNVKGGCPYSINPMPSDLRAEAAADSSARAAIYRTIQDVLLIEAYVSRRTGNR